MTLLQQIEEAVTDKNIDVMTLLRMAKRLAARLNNAEFDQWIDWELNGYPANANLPPYRVIGVVVRADICAMATASCQTLRS